MSAEVSNFVDSSRTRARSIKTRLKELGASVTLAQAYEILAAADGHRTWAAMRAAEGGAAQKESGPLDLEPHDGMMSVDITRRISLDGGAPEARFDGRALADEAYGDLSYVFMDGEDYLQLRLRDVRRIADDEYGLSVDIEMSPRKDIDWHRKRLDLCQNVVRYEFTKFPDEDVPSHRIARHSKNGRWNRIDATIDITTPLPDGYVTFELVRNLTVDRLEADDRTKGALMRAIKVDLERIYFDEEYPSIRLRNYRETGDDEFVIVADIEKSPHRSDTWHLERISLCDNVLHVRALVRDEIEEDTVEAVYCGTGDRRYGLKWLEESMGSARKP